MIICDIEGCENKSRKGGYCKDHAWEHHLKGKFLEKTYGISKEKYDEMIIEQKNLCAICKGKPNKKGLFVDHCHTTGKARRLLCCRCNMVLGQVEENIDLLNACIDYLNLHNVEENIKINNIREKEADKSLINNNKNTSGFRGVSPYKSKNKKWRTNIVINDKQLHLGTFVELEDAIQARLDAEEKYKDTYCPMGIHRSKESKRGVSKRTFIEVKNKSLK